MIQIKILKACTSCEVPSDVLVDTLNLAQYIRSQCLVVDHEETASDVSQCKMSSEEVDSAPPPPPTPMALLKNFQEQDDDDEN